MSSDKKKPTNDDAARTRSKAGPPSATPNEQGSGRDGRDSEVESPSLPKISKRKAGRGDSYGGGLH